MLCSNHGCQGLWVIAALVLASVSPAGAAEPTFVGALAWAVDDEGAKRLNLTEEQRTQLNKLIDEREGQAVSLAVELKDATPEDREAKLGPFRKESETKGLAILNEEQRKTLEQIRLEKMGATVLAEESMAEKFKLTGEQRQEIDRLVVERNTQLTTLDATKADTVRGYYDKQIVKVLDDAQLAQWQQMAPAAPDSTATGASAMGGQPLGAPPGGQTPVGRPIERTPPSADGKLRFNFRFQPWADVLDWFAYQADLSLVMDVAPPGTFNYSDTRSYTPAEAIDLLNSVLLTKGYTLVRKDRMLILINLEDGIPPNLVSDIKLTELDEKGEYELVSVLFPLDRMTAEEAEQEISRVLGPQGKVVTFPKSGYIRVTETAGRLRMIRSVLMGVDEGGSGSVRVFELEHVDIDAAMGVIRQLMNIPEEEFASEDDSVRIALDPTGKLLVTGKPEKIAQVQEVLKVVDVPFKPAAGGAAAIESPQLEVFPINGADSASVLQVLQTLMANSPDVRLATDPKTGSVVALARPSQMATIRATIDQLQSDVQQVEVIKLTRVDPQTAVLSINKLFGDASQGTNAPKVDADLVTRNLMIRGSEAQLAQIRSLLEKMGEVGTQPGSDAAANSGENVRMIPLSGRAARTALEQIQQIWPSMHQNRIRVVTPSAVVPTMRLHGDESTESEPAEPSAAAPPRRSSESRDGDRPQARSPSPAPERSAQGHSPGLVRFASQSETEPKSDDASQDASQNADEAASEARRPSQPAKPKVAADSQLAEESAEEKNGQQSPIIVAPGAGGTMIASEDIEALNEFEALLSALASQQLSGGKQYTIFYLVHASADSVAETLEQIFAGGMGSSGGGGSLLGDLAGSVIGGSTGGLVGSLLNMGSGGAPMVSGPVQIIPEPRLNALIVEASPADLDTIETLLKILDQGDLPETQVSPRPRLIPVINTSASQIATIVREVYQQRMASASGRGQRQPSPEEFIQMLRGGDRGRGGSSSRRSGSSRDEGPKMTIGVDERTNSLIVSAPNALFEEVEQLVKTLDQATNESNTAVRVVTLKRSNASTVQKALTAIAGENVRSENQVSQGSSSASSSSRDNDRDRDRSSDSDADAMRRRMEWFNRLRGGSSGDGDRSRDRSRSRGR